MTTENTFGQWKKQCLNKIDFSKKGSVDEDISHVVALLNSNENYFTTSSCSGRTILVDGLSDSHEVQKQNCSWLFVSHQKCQVEDVMSGLQRACGDAVLKFEPFILHVQTRQLEHAQLLHYVAINAGFRNSGLTVGKKGKIITAVRSSHCLEVPLTHRGQVLVCQDYIHFLVELANQKMDENLKRVQRFYLCLQSALSPKELQIQQALSPNELQIQPALSPNELQIQPSLSPELQTPDTQEKKVRKPVYKRRRRRGQPEPDPGPCDPDQVTREADLCDPDQVTREADLCDPDQVTREADLWEQDSLEADLALLASDTSLGVVP
ncbi:tRNA wybutosine-synthesizing protein 3 homolog isoform X1 [Osmerus mordax]|uniref:tRNA wybutosine-synthesizing protein 3 homolog isoform X1 n=1 Tax=Osmerus mordax TaxID=8014 RepID=UPI00350FD33A